VLLGALSISCTVHISSAAVTWIFNISFIQVFSFRNSYSIGTSPRKGFLFMRAKMTLQIFNSLLARDSPEVLYAVLLQSSYYRFFSYFFLTTVVNLGFKYIFSLMFLF